MSKTIEELAKVVENRTVKQDHIDEQSFALACSAVYGVLQHLRDNPPEEMVEAMYSRVKYDFGEGGQRESAERAIKAAFTAILEEQS